MTMKSRLEERPHVIGVANDALSLDAALALKPAAGVDFIELRLDCFATQNLLDQVDAALPRLALPLLITARRPDEGGAGDLSPARRAQLLRDYLPHARLMDLELRSAQELPDLISEARQLEKQVVLSYHDFGGTPRPEQLEELAQEAFQSGAHIFKTALTVNDLGALRRLLRFAEHGAEHGQALALMGMGRFGKVSRLLLAQNGSLLNYGSLGGSVVPGQWDAREFAGKLAEL